MKKIAFISSLLMLLFIGCQSSSSSDVSENHPLNPKVVIENLEQNGNVLIGKLKISEENNFYKNVKFENINLSSNECNISNFNPTTISNNETVNFEANISCTSELSNVKVTFDEIAQYIDTDIKTIKKSFAIDYPLDKIISNEGGISDFSLKITNVQPSSVTLKEGESYTFSVYTFDTNNNPVSVPVKIAPPLDSNGNVVGEFDKYSFYTDSMGKGEFTYKAPANLLQNDVNLSVDVKINQNIIKKLSIQIFKNVEVTINPTKLILVPQSITLSSGASYNIKIFTLDNNNRGVSSNIIIAHAIDQNNTSWGSFDKYNLTTNENGEGEVTFTATKNIDALEGNLSVPVLIQSTGLTTDLVLITPSLTREENNTLYKIDYSIPASVGVDNRFDMTIKVKNAITDTLIDNKNIDEINLTSQNHLVYFDDNSSKFTKTFSSTNNVNFKAHTSIISGIDIIDVNVSVIEDDNTTKLVNTQIPVVITSGPVSAISINAVGNSYNANTGLFEKTYAIHAVDKYSNPVQAGTKIKVGAVVNAKIVSNSGEIKANSDEFKDDNENFDNDLINNTIIVFADSNHKSPLYLGGWTVEDIIDSNTLQLATIYSGDSDVSSLFYVLGDEKRLNSCDSTLALADFDSADKTYETDEQGIAKVILRLDPYLMGKTISLYANSFQDSRVGISIKEIFLNDEYLFYEPNEDEKNKETDTPIDHTDNIWEKYGEEDENKSGTIYVGTNGGASNTIVGDRTTLLRNSPVNIRILTTSICKFTDGNISKDINTTCNGSADFEVHYDDDGTCKVELNSVQYEY